MSLLLTPQRRPDEGPMGYRFRLASANLLCVRDLVDLQLSEEGESFAFADAGCSSPWIVRWARFCPHCLRARETWHVGWEILFADACALCGSWLVDTCGECGQRISWRRPSLLWCGCGDLLASQSTRPAPDAVARLSRALVSAAIGDANFLAGDFEAGRDNLSSAMHYPDAIGNPFLHLRLGQCQFELGALERAADELSRAYMGAGAEIFSKDDPKYFDFLKTRLQRPASGQW